MALAVGIAVLATGWYYGSLQSFYAGTVQAASVFLGLSAEEDLVPVVK